MLMTTISLLTSFLRLPTIRTKFKRDDQLYHSEEEEGRGGESRKNRKRRNQHHLLERVLDAFLSLRGVILNKTKNIDDSVNLLQGYFLLFLFLSFLFFSFFSSFDILILRCRLLKLLNSESFEDNQLFMAACIKALEKYVTTYSFVSFILFYISTFLPLLLTFCYFLVTRRAERQSSSSSSYATS